MLVVSGGGRHQDIVRIEKRCEIVPVRKVATIKRVAGVDDPIHTSDDLRFIGLNGNAVRGLAAGVSEGSAA